jgi:hypothetical protein
MKFKLCTPALLLVVFISSCSDHVYGPAMRLADISYMPRPIATDTAKAANYISGGVGVNEGTHYNDLITSGQVNFSRGHTYKHFNMAYGAFGAAGNYHNYELDQTDPHYFNNKFWGAAGGRFGTNFYFHRGRFDFRLIGFEAAYSHEFGDYATFRKQIGDVGYYHADTRTDVFSMGATSEIIFRGSRNYLFGFRGFAGGTFGNDRIYGRYYEGEEYKIDRLPSSPAFVTFAYFMQLKRLFMVAEISSYAQLRFGYRF